MFEKDLFGDDVKPDPQGGVLSQSWEYPPFSVLNAREGWWQERKRAWLSLGIKSELGRGATVHDTGSGLAESQVRLDAFKAKTVGGGG